MEKQPIAHATIVLERDISASADRVFAALADPRERASWGVPSDTAVLIYDATDFRVGGADHFRCGSRDDPKFHGHTVYAAIVPGQSIVSSETVTVGGTCLSASLATVELSPAGQSTHLKLTVQLVSFVGDAMIKGHNEGHSASLDNLVRHFGTTG